MGTDNLVCSYLLVKNIVDDDLKHYSLILSLQDLFFNGILMSIMCRTDKKK